MASKAGNQSHKKTATQAEKKVKTGALATSPSQTHIAAGDFQNREALENHVRNKYGLTTDAKKVVIVGTEEELRRLFLSAGSLFWGITCVAKDLQVTTPAMTEKVDRGKRTAFGIREREVPKDIQE